VLFGALLRESGVEDVFVPKVAQRYGMEEWSTGGPEASGWVRVWRWNVLNTKGEL
jgi:hypothetical protein